MKATLLDSALPVSELGEGPFWDQRGQKFFWVDISGKRVHSYTLSTGKHASVAAPSMIGFAVASENEKLICGLQDGIYRLDFATGETIPLAKPRNFPAYNRFNDGKCDRSGRLWCGTMNLNPDHEIPTGALYVYDVQSLSMVESDIFISNGLGWSPDNKIMYYTDTVRRVIWRYDYDIQSGAASNRQIFREFKSEGRPDGMCVDRQGRILTALWPGWGVEIFTADGKPDGRIELPVPQVSSCAFGGKDFKTLMITTAKIGMSPAQIEEAPLSGQVFAIEMDVPGLPETPFRDSGTS